MTRILGISGSLRAGSFNTALLRAAQGVAGDGIELEVATLHGIPAAVQALKEKIIAADGVLIATPEYNNGVPGVLKNGIDWLSRPPADVPKLFKDRPFALMGASPGNFGTILSQAAWLPILRTLNARYWAGPKMLVSRASAVFDASGQLTDHDVARKLGEFLQGFAAFAAKK